MSNAKVDISDLGFSETGQVIKKNEVKCPYCNGLTPIIDRFNHSRFYDCPLCKGKKKVDINKMIKKVKP